MILVTMIINQLIWLKTRSVQYPNPASVSNHVGPECRTFFSVGKGVMARLHDTKTVRVSLPRSRTGSIMGLKAQRLLLQHRYSCRMMSWLLPSGQSACWFPGLTAQLRFWHLSSGHQWNLELHHAFSVRALDAQLPAYLAVLSERLYSFYCQINVSTDLQVWQPWSLNYIAKICRKLWRWCLH